MGEVAGPVLEARHITRHFGAVIALADASLSAQPPRDPRARRRQRRRQVDAAQDPLGHPAAPSRRRDPHRRQAGPAAARAGRDGCRHRDGLPGPRAGRHDDAPTRTSISAARSSRRTRWRGFFNLVDDKQMRERAREVLDSLQGEDPLDQRLGQGHVGRPAPVPRHRPRPALGPPHRHPRRADRGARRARDRAGARRHPRPAQARRLGDHRLATTCSS